MYLGYCQLTCRSSRKFKSDCAASLINRFQSACGHGSFSIEDATSHFVAVAAHQLSPNRFPTSGNIRRLC
jgi:hypothetical protein